LTEGRCVEGAVAPGGPPLAWTIGAGEKEREGRESEERSREKENAGRAESMDIYQRLQTMLRCLLWHRGLHIRQCFGVCFGTVDYISDGHFLMRESKAKI
jgi:hypothetical protein